MSCNGSKEEVTREKDELKENNKQHSKHHHRNSDKHKKSHQEDEKISHRYQSDRSKKYDHDFIKDKHKYSNRERSRSNHTKRDHEKRKRHNKERGNSFSRGKERYGESEKEKYYTKKREHIDINDCEISNKEKIRANDRDRSINDEKRKHKSNRDTGRHKSDRSHSRRREFRKSISRFREVSSDFKLDSRRSKSRSKSALYDSSPKRAWRFDSPPMPSTEALPLIDFSTTIPNINSFVQPKNFIETNNTINNFSPPIPTSIDSSPLPASILDNNNSSQNSLTNLAAAIGLDANATKTARELYVGNLPPGIDVNQLLEFLNAAMVALKASTMPGNVCNKAWISTDGHYAFVEFRTLEEASNGMQLNGLNCLGYSLRIGRPKTYPPELAALVPQPTAVALDSSYLAQGIAGVRSGIEAATGIKDSSISSFDSFTATQTTTSMIASTLGFANFTIGGKKIDRMCIMGLPSELSEEKVKSLVTTFGNVKFFQLLMKEDRTSSGVCICDFQDYESQQQAIEILTQNTSYIVMKASDAVDQGLLADFISLQIQSGDPILRPQVTTRVIMLCNLVTREELMDETEYQDIVEDVKLECASYGNVASLVIPRPVLGFSPEEVDQSDVGFAFVEFSNTDGSSKARKALSGRKFASRTVEAHYFSEIKYSKKEFKNPQPNYDKEHSSLFNPQLINN